MTETEKLSREKFETINRLLQEEFVVVHVDATADGVMLPSHLRKNPSVTLKLSKFFRGGIELKMDQIVTKLLFDKEYFECVLPWTSIWGATTVKGSNIVWPESAPQEVLKKIMDMPPPAAAAEHSQKSSASSKKASHLRRIK